MARINNQGYVERKFGGDNPIKYSNINNWRNWWLIKARDINNEKISGSIIGIKINVPKRYIGKKIRFKVEVMEE